MTGIVMESAKVAEAAKRELAKLDKYIAERNEHDIKEFIKIRRFSWKRGFYYMTYDEARELYKSKNMLGHSSRYPVTYKNELDNLLYQTKFLNKIELTFGQLKMLNF